MSFTFFNHIKSQVILQYPGLFFFAATPNTDSIKINRPGHNIRITYVLNEFLTADQRPTIRVQQNIFEKKLIEVCSPRLCASFDTFCAQIDQYFATQ